MADDDNFDIDIYGGDAVETNQEDHPVDVGDQNVDPSTSHDTNGLNGVNAQYNQENGPAHSNTDADKPNESATSPSGSDQKQSQLVNQPSAPHGTKRSHDDQPTAQHSAQSTQDLALTSIELQDIHWWTTEDQIRGWANKAGVEDQFVEVTFSEHKVNGKNKGTAFVDMRSKQAASALKHTIDTLDDAQKKPKAYFRDPSQNNFKTLPKDAPRKDGNRDSRPASVNYSGQGPKSQGHGNYQSNRGGFNNNRGGNYNNRNFHGQGMGGVPNGGFNPHAGGFGNNPMNMSQYGGYNNRGGRGHFGGGNRGNRGGMHPMGNGMHMSGMNHMNNNNSGIPAMPNMPSMPAMPNMPMGPVPNMSFPGMSGGFPGNAYGGHQNNFNQGFYPGQQSGSTDSWNNNPHGAKRHRHE